MNYKVGDKVRVKKNLKDDKQYGDICFVSSMRCFCGKVYKIQEVRRELNSYYQLENCGVWNFTDEMLEPTYTLQECIDKDYAIHCDTEDKANKLLKVLDSEGYKWETGNKYTSVNYYLFYEKETCYRPHMGMYGDISFYKSHNIKIVWFDDVILPQDKEKVSQITLKGKTLGYCELSKCPYPSYTRTCDFCKHFIGDKPILDEAEKAYLEAVLRPYKNRVISIKEDWVSGCGLDDYYYIKIDIKSICHHGSGDELVKLPLFKKNSMYKGMVFGNPYTLQELGLFADKKENKTVFDKKFDEKKKCFGKDN